LLQSVKDTKKTAIQNRKRHRRYLINDRSFNLYSSSKKQKKNKKLKKKRNCIDGVLHWRNETFEKARGMNVL
jgi:hypothetical protein